MTRDGDEQRAPKARGTICFFDPADAHSEIFELQNIEEVAEQDRHRLHAFKTLAAGLARSLSIDQIIATGKRVVSDASEIIIERADAMAATGENRSVAGRQRRAEWLTDSADIRLRYPAAGESAALAVFPLTVGTTDFGTMVLAFDSATQPDAEQWSFLQGMAELTAIALERMELRESADRERQLRDELVATLSHELRNPLATISAVAEALRIVADDPAKRARWEAALSRQVSHMDKLLSEMLDLSRLARGMFEMSQERFDVASVLLAAVEDKKLETEQRGISVRLSLRSQWIKGNAVRLTQVFHNLLGNSIKFTEPPGSIAITSRSDSNGNVVVTFTDTGTGIEAGLLPRIFEPFTQGARQAAEPGSSLGLGLALVKRIVEQHGGSVSVYSGGKGKGSTFTLVLPPAD